MLRYEVSIYWSGEDAAFVAEASELPGCTAHGDTYESALINAQDASGYGSMSPPNMAPRFPSRRGAR